MAVLRPRGALKQGRIRSAWEVVKTQLRQPGNDLDRYVQTWQFLENDDASDTGPAAWTLDMMPVLRLELDGGQVQWRNEVTQSVRVDYAFTVGIPGLDQGDVTDLFETMIPTLYPGDRSLYARLKPFGVVAYSITQAGVTRQSFPDGRGQVAKFVFSFNTELRSQY